MITFFVLALMHAVAGMSSPGPTATPSDLGRASLHQGFTPRPTDGPDVKRLDLKLLKRADEPNVCGYINGNKYDSIYCSLFRTCYFYTTRGAWGRAGCCSGDDLENCGWWTACVDGADYRSSCKSKCRIDPFTLKCTGTRSYCHTFHYPDISVLDYQCVSTAYSRWHTIETTYAGQSLESYSFRFATPTFSDADNSYSSSSRTTRRVYSTDDSYSSSSRTTRRLFPTDDTVDSSPLRISRSARPPEVGPIVGGVVGGLVLIGVAIAVCLVCLRRRRRHRRVQATVGPASQAPPPGYGPVGQIPPSTKVDAPFDPSMQHQHHQYQHHQHQHHQHQHQPQELPLHSSTPSGEDAPPATTFLPASDRGPYMPVPIQDFSTSPPNVQHLHANWASPPPRYPSGSPLETNIGTVPIYQAPNHEERR